MSHVETHPLDTALQFSIEGFPDTAENILRSLPQEDLRVKFNLGWHDFRHGKFQEGFDGMNAGRWINVFGSPALQEGTPIWKMSSRPNILLRSEGGQGDQIINARFAKNLSHHGEVILMTHPSLVSLLSTIEGVSRCIGDDEKIPEHNYWVPAMSAAGMLDLNYTTISGEPYLPIRKRKEIDDGKFRIGLRWSGNPQFEHEQHRRFDRNLMIMLSNISGAEYYSFQLDTDLCDVPFRNLQDELKTWEDTASWLSTMDLVITSDTSIAHCAAAMGIDTWNVLPIMPYYLYALPGNKTPWYDSMTLYRQEIYNNWDTPFENIRRDLIQLLDK